MEGGDRIALQQGRGADMRFAKIASMIVFGLCVLSFLAPATWEAAAWGRVLFWLWIVGHGIEFLYFYRFLRSVPGGLPYHLVRMLLFGVLHIREIRASQPA